MTSSFLDLVLRFDQLLPLLIQQYGAYVYALLFALIFLQIGIPPLFFLPGNPVLFVAGAMCAGHGLQLSIVIPLFFTATTLGSLLNYRFGKTIAHSLTHNPPSWVSLSALRKAHDFYESYGVFTFLLTPFIAMVRTFAPLAAGIARMSFYKFIASVATGALIWSCTLSLAGFYVGDAPFFKHYLGSFLLLGLTIGLGLLFAGLLWRWLNAKRRT